MVHFFLRACPETAAIATDKGKLALHFSAGDGHYAISCALLRHYPRSAALPSAKGKLPLHFCARWGYLDIARDLIRVYPDAVRALDGDGSLPLHDAAREGQYRMARYLIERFPVALQTANLRGEIPLFPAVRSAHVSLVALMIQAWPMGGKHILRNVRPDDNVTSWNWDIVELLLRGGVNNLHGCALLRGREPPTVCLTDDDVQPVALISPEEVAGQSIDKKAAAIQSALQPQPRLAEALHPWAPVTGAAMAPLPLNMLRRSQSPASAAATSTVAAMPVRSKSPILSGDRCSAGSTSKSDRKRSRSMIAEEEVVVARPFLHLHAAFECGAACEVIQLVLEMRPGDVMRTDGRGRLCLHWAVTHCRDDAIVNLVLHSTTPGVVAICTPEAARAVDHTGKLPLHLAIAARADVRVISALLEAHPAAGVERCQGGDEFYGKMPIDMATHFDCDLSTIFALLRVDPTFVNRQ